MVAKNNLKQSEYVAAVVEYSPILWTTSPQKTILKNVAQYEEIIDKASQYDVDILVFPESGLTGVPLPKDRKLVREYLSEIPNPKNRIVPHLDSRWNEVLRKLSYAAWKNGIYVVVNLPEIYYCKANDADCPEDNVYYYNTNIVFDRKGAIIARYRKHNLFIETGFNTPKEAELCTFDTDFGVTFGMFICFDILFHEPSVRLVKEKNVTDIVYSTAWYSELPLLSAVGVQSAWAYSMDVNFLASGYDNPEQMGGGSGIYAGIKGPLVTLMPECRGTKILIARVPKKTSTVPSSPSVLEYILELEENLLEKPRLRSNSIILPEKTSNRISVMRFLNDASFKDYTVKPLYNNPTDNFDKITNTFKYSKSGFSCNITVIWKNDPNNNNVNFDYYKMFAYSGKRNFSTASTNHIEVCGLVLCHDPSNAQCGTISDIYTKSLPTILSIKITAESYNLLSIPIPSTLNTTVYPLEVSEFKFSSSIKNVNNKDVYSIEMELLKPVSDLVTFAVYKLPSK